MLFVRGDGVVLVRNCHFRFAGPASLTFLSRSTGCSSSALKRTLGPIRSTLCFVPLRRVPPSLGAYPRPCLFFATLDVYPPTLRSERNRTKT